MDLTNARLQSLVISLSETACDFNLKKGLAALQAGPNYRIEASPLNSKNV